MFRRPPRSTLFPTRRSSDLVGSETRARELQLIIAFRHAAEQKRSGGIGRCGGNGAAPVRLQLNVRAGDRSEEHTSELQSQFHLVCRLLLEKKKTRLQCNTLA